MRIEKPVKLKNYTSGVAVSQTIARIEARLAAVGANEIVKIYGPEGRVAAVRFYVDLDNKRFCVMLPANADACFDAMWADYRKHTRRPHPSAKARITEQAARTAWKLVQDWVDVQVSLIVMRQAEWLQVFMAYLYSPADCRTVYQVAKEAGFKTLPCAERVSERALGMGDLAEAMLGGQGPIPLSGGR